jgi:MFS family permease
LTKSYPAAVLLVVCALVPFLMLTAAILPLSKVIAPDVGLSTSSFDLAVAMSNAAYAFGTVLAVQLAQHLRPRRLLVVYATTFVVASALTAWGASPAMFVTGLVVQGLCTSLMLIAAVPPLVTSWPARKMPFTAMIMNLCIFGAVAAGPSLGAIQAHAHHWRPLFVVVAGIGVLAVAFVLLTFEDDERADADAPWDVVAVLTAAIGCAAAFFGAGYLQGHDSAGAVSVIPLVAGVVVIVVLITHQYRVRKPLMPVRQLATTFPLTGIVLALFASAAAFGLTDLLLTSLATTRSTTQIAEQFLPEFVAAVVTAGGFALVFRTRFIPLFAFAGALFLVAGSAVALHVVSSSDAVSAYVATALIGLGVGASVSPGLFLAGFSLRSAQIQRVFALIELLRGVTAFLVAPVLAFLVTQLGSSPKQGTEDAVWICLAVAAAGALASGAIFGLGAARLQTPDIERWQGEGEPAWESPPPWGRLRPGRRAQPARQE